MGKIGTEVAKEASDIVLLDVALAMEPKEEGLLRGNFERPKKYLIDKLMAQRMFFMAVPMMIGTLFLFKGYFEV